MGGGNMEPCTTQKKEEKTKPHNSPKFTKIEGKKTQSKYKTNVFVSNAPFPLPDKGEQQFEKVDFGSNPSQSRSAQPQAGCEKNADPPPPSTHHRGPLSGTVPDGG